MPLTFDTNGFLSPYSAIVTDLETFRQTFVDDFRDSTTRKAIFENYQNYLDTFKTVICETGFYQWIDGSFVTQKINPNDLDIVTFVDTEVFTQKIKELQALKGDALVKNQKLDCYFVEVIPSNSRQYFIYQSDKMYWLTLFSYTKRHPRTDKRYEKGFIQLNF